MEHIKFKTERTGHVYTLGNNIETADYIWFVFHGYGQLASTIITKFENVDLDKHFIISIEGLSRFYWEGVYGRVVASWMTKGDRLEEIDDYLGFINKVYDQFEISERKAQFCCLAFSQGTATCWRWLNNRRPKLHSFVQWAGTYPPELDYKNELQSYLQSFDQHFLYGDKDEFITPKLFKKLEAFIKDNNINPKVKCFEGEHKIYANLLEELIGSM